MCIEVFKNALKHNRDYNEDKLYAAKDLKIITKMNIVTISNYINIYRIYFIYLGLYNYVLHLIINIVIDDGIDENKDRSEHEPMKIKLVIFITKLLLMILLSLYK